MRNTLTKPLGWYTKGDITNLARRHLGSDVKNTCMCFHSAASIMQPGRARFWHAIAVASAESIYVLYCIPASPSVFSTHSSAGPIKYRGRRGTALKNTCMCFHSAAPIMQSGRARFWHAIAVASAESIYVLYFNPACSPAFSIRISAGLMELTHTAGCGANSGVTRTHDLHSQPSMVHLLRSSEIDSPETRTCPQRPHRGSVLSSDMLYKKCQSSCRRALSWSTEGAGTPSTAAWCCTRSSSS
jgi:hypothetical protein